MRQIFWTINITGLLLISVYLLKDKIHFAPRIGSPRIEQQTKVILSPRFKNGPQKTTAIITKGDRNEDRTIRNRTAKTQRPRSRENESPSDKLDEIEKLSSIYQGQETSPGDSFSSAPTEVDVGPDEPTQLSSEKDDQKTLNFEAQKRSSPIPGVKVSAWVKSQKNTVAGEVPDPRVGRGMRYFLNCVELKDKGVLPLTARDCESLITDRRFKN